MKRISLLNFLASVHPWCCRKNNKKKKRERVKKERKKGKTRCIRARAHAKSARRRLPGGGRGGRGSRRGQVQIFAGSSSVGQLACGNPLRPQLCVGRASPATVLTPSPPDHHHHRPQNTRSMVPRMSPTPSIPVHSCFRRSRWHACAPYLSLFVFLSFSIGTTAAYFIGHNWFHRRDPSRISHVAFFLLSADFSFFSFKLPSVGFEFQFVYKKLRFYLVYLVLVIR